MALFFDVITHEGDVENLICKFEGEDFNTKSRLVVQQGQEAIFYYKGIKADQFTPGTYVLETQNIPILCKLVNLPFGKVSPFHAAVYFVNTTEQMNINWGASKIPFIDRDYFMPLMTGIHGAYCYKVHDADVLMQKFVGTSDAFSVEQMKGTLNTLLVSKIIQYMTAYYKENNLDLFRLESKINDLSSSLGALLKQDFLEYGIQITKFIVVGFNKNEESPEYTRYFNFRTQKASLTDILNRGELAAADATTRMQVAKIETETRQDLSARGIRVEAEARAYGRAAEGITIQEEKGFEVADHIAQNSGTGGLVSAGIGAGLGLGVAQVTTSALGGTLADALSNLHPAQNQPQTVQQPSLGADLGDFGANVGLEDAPAPSVHTAKFCENCGFQLPPDAQFCDNCGTPQISAERCKKCGFVFERPGKFCPKCGERRE